MDESGSPETITSDDVNGYLRETSGLHVTAKNLRTCGGTILADTELREMGPVPNEREATRNIIRAIDAVAERLGNTRTVCRKYYVHPALLEAYLQGLTAGPSVSASPRKARRKRRVVPLRRDEVAILQFLHDLE